MCDIDADIPDPLDDPDYQDTNQCTLCGCHWYVGDSEPGIICTLPDNKVQSPGFALYEIRLCDDCALFVSKTFEQHLHEQDKCEHGVICGEWCEPCNRAYKDALYENSIEDVRRENAELRKECAEKAVAEQIVNLIDYLISGYSDSVEICAADDADEPDQLISVCGEWTDFNVDVIAGKSVLECLRTAADKRRKKEQSGDGRQGYVNC